jgi:hypothetical protein
MCERGGFVFGVFLIMASLALLVVAIFVPVLAKIIIHFDYVIIFVLVWAFVFGAGGSNEHGLLLNYEIHTVFVILIYLAFFGALYGLQQIRIFNIYIFRVAACACSAYVIVYLISNGWFGSNIAEKMDVIWQWTLGILYFIISVVVRTKEKNLMRT